MSPFILVVLILAAVPAVLFLLNLVIYRPLPAVPPATSLPGVSVLIPARNEEGSIAACLQAALDQPGVELEVVVLDDHSTDGTAGIVRGFGDEDPRVRLETPPPLPVGWCGKQHACHVLAGLARHPILVFVDADVRLSRGAVARMAAALVNRRRQLLSGVPRQITRGFLERLLIPLIHFVLLGYLPMPFMRWFRSPAFAAGCGQLFVVTAEGYRKSGGHAALRASLHDGLKLPKVFRQAGQRTDLFDATDAATCRMYHSGIEVWRGLGKNATEGLAHPARIVPMSLLLLGGQVVPWILLGVWPQFGWPDRAGILAAVALSGLPRLVSAWRFRQPWDGALLHPLGITILLLIQWQALFRSWRGRPAQWKGRNYPTSS